MYFKHIFFSLLSLVDQLLMGVCALCSGTVLLPMWPVCEVAGCDDRMCRGTVLLQTKDLPSFVTNAIRKTALHVQEVENLF